MINWVTIPFVRLLLPLLIGIVSGVWLDRPLAWTWLLFLLLLPPLIYYAWQRGNYRGRWIFGVLVSLLLCCFGAWRGSTYNELYDVRHYTKSSTGDTLQLIGLLDTWPTAKTNSVQTVLWIEAIRQESQYRSATGYLLLYLEKDSSSLALRSGDRIAVRTTARPIDPVRNPQAFDYRRYLHFQNVHRQGYADTVHWTLLARKQSRHPEHLLAPLREKLLAILRTHLKTTETFSVGAALILGYKREIDDRIRDSYADTGAMHVLAVSGLHVGLIYVIFGFLLRLVWPPHRRNELPRSLLLAAIVWLFALLTGAGPSVLRAATMFSFIALGKSFTQKHYIFNTLALSALIWLVIDPYLLFNVGFQLSYLAVGGIVYWQRRIYRLFVFYNNLLDAAWKLTSVSIAAQILTLPISLFYFHQFPVYFWLSGLIVIPAATVILSLGLALFTFSWVPILSTLLGKLLCWIIALVNALIYFIHALPGSVWRGIWVSGAIVLLSYAFIWLLIQTVWSRKGRWVLACSALLLFFCGASSFVTLRTHYQRQATIYHLRKHSLLDIMDGDRVYSYHSEQAPVRDRSFAAQNYRWQRRVRVVQAQAFGDTIASGPFPYRHYAHAWQLGKRRLVRLDEHSPESTRTLPVDYLWIAGKVSADPAETLAAYPSTLVILDGASPRYLRQRWHAYLAANDIPFHDTAAHGAFTFSY